MAEGSKHRPMKKYDFSKVLTTGSRGMIGSYVDFGIRTDSETLDVLDREAVLRFVKKHKPRAIIHLAGATDMERCERDPNYAFELNTLGTYNVALAARSVGATLVYASTSRVFSGEKKAAYTEKDVPDPRGNYGVSKHIGEMIAASVPHSIIARTSWVFGGGPERDNKFYGKVLQQLDESEIIAIDDVHGSPTYGKDFIRAIQALLAQRASGIFHLGNSGAATRADIARQIVHTLKPSVRVRAVGSSYFQSSAYLPKNESMSSKKHAMRPWKVALAEYLDEEWRPYLQSKQIIP